MLQATGVARARHRAASAPIVIANEEHRFLVAEQLREVGDRAAGDRARAGRPQHRAGRSRPPRCCCAPRHPERAAAGAAVRPCDRRCRCVPAAVRARQARGRAGRAGDVRHRADGAGHRLRLHPARRAAAEGGGFAVDALRREARSGPPRRPTSPTGGYYWNSGMFLFRARRYPAGAASAIAPTIARAARAAMRQGAARRWTSCASTATPSRGARTTRSTTR